MFTMFIFNIIYISLYNLFLIMSTSNIQLTKFWKCNNGLLWMSRSQIQRPLLCLGMGFWVLGYLKHCLTGWGNGWTFGDISSWPLGRNVGREEEERGLPKLGASVGPWSLIKGQFWGQIIECLSDFLWYFSVTSGP